MVYNWLSTGMALYSLLRCTIRLGRALMLAQVFRPGVHEKYLQVAICILHISKNPPPVRAVATPHAGVPIDGFDKFWYLLWVYFVLNRHHDWAVVRRRGVPLQYGGHPPMNPGCQIDR
jgi:hypothetical protein